MAKGYWIAHNQVTDVEAYEAYKVAKTIREPVSIGDIVIVEGYDG